ncbi:MAG: hypothetical protein ACRDGG_03130 [Anaerolineae bacterium]
MAAPSRVTRASRLTPDESYRRHVQRKKIIALIAGLVLLPASIFMILSFDRGPMGQAFAEVLGVTIGGGQPARPTPTSAAIAAAQSPTPTACLDTVFNGLIFDAETDALLNGVQVSASFGGSAVTSPDGEYNILVCYDPAIHDGFSLGFEKEGYESASLDVVTIGYPGISFQVDDMGLYSIQTPTPAATACLDTVFNGLVFDAETNALLGGVQVTASFGDSVVTSPDGEYNIPVCYDTARHDGFSLIFERDGYESASLDVVTTGYPGISFQVDDMGLYSIQTATPAPTVFQPPRQTPLPTPTPTLIQPPRQTPLPTATPGLFQPPRQTALPTATASPSGSGTPPTSGPPQGSGTPTPTDAPPNTLPVTGLQAIPFPGQAIGFVLLAISVMLITAGLWPQSEGDDRW